MADATWDRAKALFQAADEEKAVQILLLDLRPLTVLCDYFLICHGNSITHVEAIGEGIVQKMKEQGVRPLSVEQPRDPKWVVLDYGDVVVHIFTEAARRFYNLEGLWGEAAVVHSSEDADALSGSALSARRASS